MARYRKKPVVIEAVQWFRDGDHPAVMRQEDQWVISTLEGPYLVTPGDWIIRGVVGEYYPCKDAIFRMTYDLELD